MYALDFVCDIYVVSFKQITDYRHKFESLETRGRSLLNFGTQAAKLEWDPQEAAHDLIPFGSRARPHPIWKPWTTSSRLGCNPGFRSGSPGHSVAPNWRIPEPWVSPRVCSRKNGNTIHSLGPLSIFKTTPALSEFVSSGCGLFKMIRASPC